MLPKIESNSVQQFSALNAFRSNKNVKPSQKQETEDVSEGINTTSTPNLLNKIDVNEIKEYAKSVGEFNLTDDDIKYGILYGRSVIAEWLC